MICDTVLAYLKTICLINDFGFFVMQEIVKLLLTLLVLITTCGGFTSLYDLLSKNIFHNKRATLLMAVPSCLYALQNNMVFLALANINVPTQQVSRMLVGVFVCPQ